MRINNRIVHCYMRARSIDEGSASVHNKDTPRDAGLINTLWHQAQTEIGSQFQETADAAFIAFGRGFCNHDVLIEQTSKRVFICETGYEFDDKSYVSHLEDVADQIEGLKGCKSPDRAAASSAPVFGRGSQTSYGLGLNVRGNRRPCRSVGVRAN